MEKAYVRTLFDSIARRYDFLNHLLSGGIDFHWRKKAIDQLIDFNPGSILDVACGTADFSIAALRLKPERVVGVDIAEQMLFVGREKIRKLGHESTVRLESGEAESLRFDDGTFDASIVAFGVRNFENLRMGLSEMNRVLRPGGKVVVLEFSKPSAFPFRQIYLFYFHKILPWIGQKISGHSEAYTYLRDTVMAFPEGNDFLAILKESGFTDLGEQRQTFGIATIYTGVKHGSAHDPSGKTT